MGVGLVMSRANAEGLNEHLAEIARTVTPGAHAVLVMDGAGWHKSDDLVVPSNISLLHLPPYAPELNPVENIWQYLRRNKLAHRLYNVLSPSWTSQGRPCSPPQQPLPARDVLPFVQVGFGHRPIEVRTRDLPRRRRLDLTRTETPDPSGGAQSAEEPSRLGGGQAEATA